MTQRATVDSLLPIIRPAQIMLVQRTGVVSQTISRVTKCMYSHAALIGESQGVYIILESTVARGVTGVKVETILDDPRCTGVLIRDRLDLTALQREQIVQAAWLKTGAKYDNRVNTAVLWAGMTLIPGSLNIEDAFNCAELIREAYNMVWGEILDFEDVPTPAAFALTEKLNDVWQWEAGGD